MPKRPSKTVRESVSLYDAKTHLSTLVDRASAGEEIVILKSGKARARLVPMEDTRQVRTPARGKGLWKVGRDFDAPLPDELLGAFGGQL